MNPFGNFAYILLGVALVCVGAMVASFGFEVWQPWLGIAGVIGIIVLAFLVFTSLESVSFH
jgi:DMSO/TMAO reductase YedYZ heme-binding membrane subunit